METKTSIQLIRNATLVFNYAGKKILIDPMLAKKGIYPGFEGTVNSHLNNPLVELPVPAESLLDVDAVIVTHLHPDHWDEVAIQMLPKNKLIFSQNENDAKIISESGFSNVSILSTGSKFDNINLHITSCQHGPDEAYAHPQIAKILGDASGVIFSHPDEKTVYLVGDSIWTDTIEENLKNNQPDVVILNAGSAIINGFDPIIMGKEDVLKVHQILPNAIIIIDHLEAINHCTLGRNELREFVVENNIADKVIIPEDGQLIEF